MNGVATVRGCRPLDRCVPDMNGTLPANPRKVKYGMVAYAQRYYVPFASIEKSEKRFGFMTRGIAFMIMVAECLLCRVSNTKRVREMFSSYSVSFRLELYW